MSTIQQLRATPVSIPRHYMLTHVLSSLSLDANACDELFEAVGVDPISVSLVVSHIVSAGCSAEQKYALLLGGMSQFTSRYSSSAPATACIRSLTHGIVQVFDDEAVACAEGRTPQYSLERHPLVRAMYLVPLSAFIAVERIEARLVSGASWTYFSAVEPFLIAALAADDGIRRWIRGMVARVGTNGLVPVDAIVPFMVQHMVVASDASTPDGMQELSEAIQDVVDVTCANDPSRSTCGLVVRMLYDCFRRGGAMELSLRCLSYFVDELSMDMVLPIAIRGMQLGEGTNAADCFDLVTAMLSSLRAKPEPPEDTNTGPGPGGCPVALTLATLETVCLRASFYCQPGSVVRGSVRKCLAMCRSWLAATNTGVSLWGPSEEALYRLKLLGARLDSNCSNGSGSAEIGQSGMRKDRASIRDSEGNGTSFGGRQGQSKEDEVEDRDIANVLAHLSHMSIFIRLEALNVVRKLASSSAVGEQASFFALPTLLHTIRTAGKSFTRHSSCRTKTEDLEISVSYYMRELLLTLANLGEARACAPFVARTIESLLTDGAPKELVGVAIRLLGRLYFSSHRGYASLKVVLLGCDLKREATDELTVEQHAALSTLLDVCERAPEKGKDFVHMIHGCASSSHPFLATAGLRCIRMLCAAGILDFEKAWVVISKMYPDLPESEELAAAWVDLIACALLERDLNDIMASESDTGGNGDDGSNLEARASMVANIIELVWEATSHSSSCVRRKAYSALGSIDWDVAEALSCLRPPVSYARLLAKETEPSALEALEQMLDAVIQMEHDDRRKQLIELKAHVPVQIQQSHRQQFYKLTQSVPRLLLKELSLLGSGAFVALNLRFGDYFKTGRELCDPNTAASIDLMVEPEYVPLLAKAWTTFVQRWCGSPEMSCDSEGFDAHHVWSRLGLDAQANNDAIINPNIPTAMVACASVRKDLVKPTIQCLVRNLENPLQHQNVKNVCVVLAALCADLTQKLVNGSAHDELTRCIMRADVTDEYRMLAIDICSPSPQYTSETLESMIGTDCDRTAVRKRCDQLRRSTLQAYANGSLDDTGICDALAHLSTMLDLPSSELHAGYILLTMSRLLTEALANGFRDHRVRDDTWTLDNMVSRLAAHLEHDASSNMNVRSNSGHVCLGLGVCLQYQMKDMKNQDESCSQEIAVENVLESICSMPAASPLRMGCVPFIADMCARAYEFKEMHIDQEESLGSLSTSAVGYLSEALLRGTFPDDSRVRLLLSCLARAPRLARKDWSGCLRRCLKSNPAEDVHLAVVNFISSHAFATSEFIANDMFDGGTGPALLPLAHRAALSRFDRVSVVMQGDTLSRCLLNAIADTKSVADAAALAMALRRLLVSSSAEGKSDKDPENDSLIRDVLGQLSEAYCPVGWCNELATFGPTTGVMTGVMTGVTTSVASEDRIANLIKLCSACAVA